MLDQFHLCIQDSIENIIDVKADGNCGYRAIAVLLGMGEELWSLVHATICIKNWQAGRKSMLTCLVA